MLSALIRGVLLLVLAGAIVTAWGVAVTANVAHAYQLAGTSSWAHLFAAASAASDVFKAAAAFGFFYAISRYKWGAVAACAVVWVITTGWSVKSLIGFSSTLVTETQLIKSETLKTSQATRESIEKELFSSIEKLDWLRPDTTTKVTGANARERSEIREERQASLDKAALLEKRIDELRLQLSAHTAKTIQGGVVSDPVGMFLVQATGMDLGMLNNVATVIGFLLLIEVCSNLPFLAFGPLFERREPPVVIRTGEAIAPVRIPAPPPVAHRTGAPKRLGMGLAEIQRRRVSPAGETKRAQATAYRDDLVALHGAGAVLSDVDVIDAFPAWAEREKVAPMLPHLLGQQLGCVGVVKVERDGRTHYMLPT